MAKATRNTESAEEGGPSLRRKAMTASVPKDKAVLAVPMRDVIAEILEAGARD
jgi:hypothetical protein